MRGAEPDKYWFGMQIDSEGTLYAALNSVFQGDNVAGFGSPAVHDGQRVLAGDTHRANCESFVKACIFHQPGSGDFQFAIAGRISRDLFAHPADNCIEVVKLSAGQDGVLEERPSAATIFIVRHYQHSFAMPNSPYGVAGFCECWRRGATGEMFFQVGILDSRRSPMNEQKLDFENDVSSP